METNDSKLSNQEIYRYSRQLIIPEFTINSQIKLKNKSALVIGCGGLGCPAALYLSTSGVGTLGLVDNDTIEITNIHRQIAHDSASIGSSKAQSLANKCKALNDLVVYKIYECLFQKEIAISLIQQFHQCNTFDVILDCTDNVITRYLINDVCVLLNKPLVSGSALKFEGQLTVYNYLNGPCYRCLYAKAPPPETVANCSDAGILGPIVGMIGSLQALEAIKILAEIGVTLTSRMLIFDGLDFQTRIIKLRPKQPDCLMCGHQNETKNLDFLDKFDYNQFCGVANYNDKTLQIRLLDSATQRVTCSRYKEISGSVDSSHLLIDCRPQHEFQICSLPDSINLPIDKFTYDLDSTLSLIKSKQLENKSKTIYIVCRRGNDSQIAADILMKSLGDCDVKDLIGGLCSWSKSVDENFPVY